jgi:nitroreductase
MDALTLLKERRSSVDLGAPGPSGDVLENVLRAGLRVPDFQYLRPYRFIIAAGEGLDRLGALFANAARTSGKPDSVINRAKSMPHRAPMVIVVVAKARHSDIVNLYEQQLSAGCAVMAMQMAAVAQGYGGIWRSGWLMYDRTLRESLGLAANDRIVGFLYLGTPQSSPKNPLPMDKLEDFVEWL